MTAGSWAAIAIGCAALLFTIFSFWWMHWRPGRLILSTIRFISIGMGIHGTSTDKNLVAIGLPLIFMNTGARPIVLERLQLMPHSENWPDEISELPRLELEGEDDTLHIPSRDPKIKRDYFVLPMVLGANDVRRGNFVFQAVLSGFHFQPAIYRYQLQYVASGSGTWRALREIVIDLREASSMDIFNLNEYCRVYPYPYRPWPE